MYLRSIEPDHVRKKCRDALHNDLCVCKCSAIAVVVAEHKVDRFSDLFGQLGALGQSVRARGEVARDDHDFAGRLVD
jgi:hypothetical protein